MVTGEKFVPLATPDDLDDVPSGAAEEALELLDDLAVSTHRPVEALQVAVDDEVEIVEAVVGGELEGSAALDLIHFTVAEEGPDLLVRGILDPAVGEVFVRLGLVDRVDRTETHRDCRELPEVRHEPRVRVGREPAWGMRLLLAESVELVGAQTPLEERAGVHAGGGMALVEDLVATARVVLAAEEMVAADLVQGGGAGVGGDVTADGDTGTLCAMHSERGIPAEPGTVAALEIFVAGEVRLVLGGDRVEVVRRRDHGYTEVQFLGPLEQAQHDLAGALVTLCGHQFIEGFLPFGSFLRVSVGVVHRVRILVVHRQR